MNLKSTAFESVKSACTSYSDCEVKWAQEKLSVFYFSVIRALFLCSQSAWQHGIKEDKLGTLLKCSRTQDLFFVLLPMHFSKKETAHILQNWSKHVQLTYKTEQSLTHIQWKIKQYDVEKNEFQNKRKNLPEEIRRKKYLNLFGSENSNTAFWMKQGLGSQP